MAQNMKNKFSQVELSISCKKLRNKDTFSKSDPFCVVYTKKDSNWIEVARTEKIDNQLDPVFVTKVIVDYRFEEVQYLRFEVRDYDSKTSSELIGFTECRLTELLSAKTGFDRELENPTHKNHNGTIHVFCEEVSQNKDAVTMTIRGRKLPKKDLFSSDPFLCFYRTMEDGTLNLVHKTDVKKSTCNPDWNKFTISSQVLCNGDKDRAIVVKCYDDDGKKSQYMGEFSMTLSQLMGGKHTLSVELLEYKECTKNKEQPDHAVVPKDITGGKPVGMIEIDYEVTHNHSFLDYIRGGTEISMMVAVDFTGSNGDPKDADSLHYLRDGADNQYQQAIRGVGEVLAQYDADQKFPAYGFGARVHNDIFGGEVSHAFPLNMDLSNAEVNGVQGILDAYRSAMSQVSLSGPTNLRRILELLGNVSSAPQRPPGSKYYVLMILTDGEITDMSASIKEIIKCSKLPCSIIILGIGSANFDKMETLDGDDGMLKMGSEVAVRDIVQFVPVRKYYPNITQLCQEVLREVPDQLLGYMRNNNIAPNTPPAYTG